MRRPGLRGDEAAGRRIGARVAAPHRLQPRARGQSVGHGIGQRFGQVGNAQHHLLIVQPGQRVAVVGAVELQHGSAAARAVEELQHQRTVAAPVGDSQATARAGSQRHRAQFHRQLGREQLDARRIRVLRAGAESAGVGEHAGAVRPGRAGNARQAALRAVQRPATAARVACQRVGDEGHGRVQEDGRESIAQVDHLDALGKGQQQHVVMVQRHVQRRRRGRAGVARHLAGKGAEAHQRAAGAVPAGQRAEAVAQQRQAGQVGFGQLLARGAIDHGRRGALGAQAQQRPRRGIVHARNGVGRQRDAGALQRAPVRGAAPHPEALAVAVHVSTGP